MTSSFERLAFTPCDSPAAPPVPAGAAVPGAPVAWAPPALCDDLVASAAERAGGDSARTFAEGVAEGRSQAERAHDAARATFDGALATTLRRLDDASRLASEDREADLLALATAIARRLVEDEIAVQPERVGDLVRRALELVPAEADYEIRLHPEDLAALSGRLEALLPVGRHLAARWVPDVALSRGDVLVNTPARLVDGRIDTALRALYERFADA